MSEDVKIITTPIEYIEAGERLMAERQADRIESTVSGAEYAKLEAELATLTAENKNLRTAIKDMACELAIADDRIGYYEVQLAKDAYHEFKSLAAALGNCCTCNPDSSIICDFCIADAAALGEPGGTKG